MDSNNNTTTQSSELNQFALQNLGRLHGLGESSQAGQRKYIKIFLKTCPTNELEVTEKTALFKKIVAIWREFDHLKQQDIPLDIMKWETIQEEIKNDAMQLAAPYVYFLPSIDINFNKKVSACNRHYVELVYALFSIQKTFEPMLNDSTSKKNLDLALFYRFYIRTIDAYMQCLSAYKERLPNKKVQFIPNIQDSDRDQIIEFIQRHMGKNQSIKSMQRLIERYQFIEKYKITDKEELIESLADLKERYQLTQHRFAILDEMIRSFNKLCQKVEQDPLMIRSFNKLCQKVEQDSLWIYLPPRLSSFVEMNILDAHLDQSSLSPKSQSILDELSACPNVEFARLSCLIEDFQAPSTNQATLYEQVTQSIEKLKEKCSKELIYQKPLVEQTNRLIIKFNELLVPEAQVRLIFLCQKDCMENTRDNRFNCP